MSELNNNININKTVRNYEPLGSIVTKEDINDINRRFYIPRVINPTILFIVILITVGFIILRVVNQNIFGTDNLDLLILSIRMLFIVLISVILLKLYIKHEFKIYSNYVRLERFAILNGLKFIPYTSNPSYTGMIFNIGKKGGLTNS